MAQDGAKALPQVTVTGTSLATEVLRYPGSVTVVSPQALSTATTAIDTLTSVPGVSTGDDFGRGLGQQFHIRGFGYQSEERVIILQDGVRRSASMYSNHISNFRADPDLLQRIEVVKGASSVQHGGGAIGGVVDMRMKQAADFFPAGKDRGFATRLRYEHNNYREGYLAGALAPRDQPYELLVYGKRGTRGDQTMSRHYTPTGGQPRKKVDTDEDLQVAYLEGAFKPGQGQRLALSHFDYRMDVVTAWQNLWHPTISTVTGPVTGKLRQQDTQLKYSFAPAGNPLIDLQASLYHSSGSYDRGYDYVNTTSGQPVSVDYKNMDKRKGLRLANTALFETGSVPHRLSTGVTYERRSEDATWLENGSYEAQSSMPNSYRDLGAHAHLESSWLGGALVTQLGGRYDRFDRRLDRLDTRHKNSRFSPRVGASVRIAPGLYALGNVAQTFRAPTPHELYMQGAINPRFYYQPNPALGPEKAREAELGFSFERKGVFTGADRLDTKFMYFRGNIKDMIALRRIRQNETSPSGAPYATYQNVENARRSGFEWTAQYEQPRFGTSMAFSRVRQTDKSTGDNVPRTFADKLSLSGWVSPAQGLRLGLAVNHWRKPKQSPPTTVVSGTTLWYVRDDFTIVDLTGSYKLAGAGWLGRDVQFDFGVKNLFDATYREASNVETATLVGKGRNLYVGVSARF